MALLILFINLGKRPYESWDEGTNIAVTLHTNAHPENISLIHNQEAFLEKPPLWFYFAQSSVQLFGYNLASIRAISALSGVGVVLIILQILKRFGTMSAFVGGLSFLAIGHNLINNPSGYFSTHTFRSADLDALQIFFLTAAFALIFRIKSSKKSLYLLTAMLGCAFLTKGFYALFWGGLIFIYLLVKRAEYKLNPADFFKQLSFFILMILPWHIYMIYYAGSDFIATYLQYHFLLRVLTPLENHRESLFYYLGLFTNWRVNVIWPLGAYSIYHLLKSKKDEFYLACIMLLGTVLMFTFTATKLGWYILPIYPLMSILIGKNYSKLKSKAAKLIWLGLICLGITFNLIVILSGS